MAHLIFRLRQVPDDEAEDIRQLLRDARLDYYETDAGNWGISMPGLWLTDPEDIPRAEKLIDQYQQERARQVRLTAESEAAAGRSRTFLHSLVERPLYTLGMIIFCAALIYLMVRPFIGFISP